MARTWQHCFHFGHSDSSVALDPNILLENSVRKEHDDFMDPFTHALAFIGGCLFIGAVWGISFKQKQSGRFLWWRGRK